MPGSDAPKRLKPGDLFEDREVSTADADELAHAQIAEQLADLAMTVPTPSNIALYGPWGSGKSGIGNLIRQALRKRKGMKFVRFDAYKYAEAPLRRNFISAVASQLHITKAKYHADLYTGRTRTEIRIPASKIFRIVGVFVVLLLGICVLLAAMLAIVAALQTAPFGEAFGKLAGQAANAALVPATLLSALVTLSNKSLQVDRSLGKPDSDEQFESIFTDLVADSKAGRLVIFVDEIDRCSANEVVATLDAIRTFLGVDKCVFIIAADQQVLEESLTQAAKQETPANEVNPYYSTGSAYLDKVFQYQVSLPPLLSQRITRFAADRVKDRPGLWSEISSEYVVSVLVPTHVTSPRRVKHLLNAFALSYRLAEDRFHEGLLSEDPRTSAASLAKLVCLRVEFPLFARDLEIDARLPEIVLNLLAATDGSTLNRSWPPQAVERARAYASQHEAPASLLSNESDEGSYERTVVSSNEQLLDYLRRTKPVMGPSRDLVFMHSSGAAFGLDGHLALAIESAAENADVAAVSEKLTEADAETRQGAVDLLNHLMRTSVGLGAPNVAFTLLSLYAADRDLPVGHVADAASESIAFLVDLHRDILDGNTVEAAWSLAALGSSDGAHRLREAVLNFAESIEDIDASFILRNPLPALGLHRGSLAELTAATLVRPDGQESVAALGDLSDDTLLDLLDASRSRISSALGRAFNEYDHAAEALSQTAPPSSTAATNDATDEVAEPVPFDPQPLLNALVGLAHERVHSGIRDQLVLLLLAIDVKQARNAVESVLSYIRPVQSSAVVDALLAAVSRRAVQAWPQWIGAIDADAIDVRNAAALGKAVDTLWGRIRVSDPPSTKSVKDAVSVLVGVFAQLPDNARPNLTSTVAEDLTVPVLDQESADARTTLMQRLQPLVEARLVDSSALGSVVLPSLHETFSADFGAIVTKDSPIGRYLSKELSPLVREGVRTRDDGARLAHELVDDVGASSWFEEPFRSELQLILIYASGDDASSFNEAPDLTHVVSLVDEFGPDVSNIVELWLSTSKPTFDETAALLKALRARGVSTEDLAAVLRPIRLGWSPERRLDLLRAELLHPDAGRLSAVEASMLGLSDVEEIEFANMLIERFQACHNNTQRRAVVDVWKTAQLTDDTARRRLIQSIVIGLLQPSDDRAHRNPPGVLVEIPHL